MKYALIGWNAILTIALVYMFIRPEKNPQAADVTLKNPSMEDSSSTSAEKAIDSKQSGIVFINTDSLFDKYEMYEDLQNELIAEKKRMEGQYKRKLEKLEKEYLELREKAPFMTQSQGEAAQADLMSKQQDLVKMEQDLAIEFKERESEMVNQIQRSIEEYILEINENDQYHFVLGKSSLSGILFASENRDITEQVVEGLNQKYRQAKEEGSKK